MIERQRQPWEALVISWCIAAITVVFTVCIIIAMIGLLVFGLHVLSNHS